MKSEEDEDERIETPYGDLWFVRSRDGTMLVPMYSDSFCARAAIAAFLAGDYGSLLVDEIEWFKSL